ncbi:MAG: hypothetical protein COA58_07510 [Bacteroidetes bacterium]|nr:MAG: hypothetical protein COA58_07510 [Bacteroidota bacterium]
MTKVLSDFPENDNLPLRKLKNRLLAVLPKNRNIALCLADILNLSKESIYRRLRGETSFTFEELVILRHKLGISVDELSGDADNISFSFRPLYGKPQELQVYLSEIIVRFKKLTHIENSNTYNVCEDLPFFRQFGYDALSSFKLFYWKHSILQDSDYTQKKFGLDTISPNILELTQTIHQLYSAVPSTEIWTEKTVFNTLKQIEYYYDCGLFESDDSAKAVYLDLQKLLDNLISEASQGYKMTSSSVPGGNFQLHLCELSLDNNSIFLETNEPKYLAMGFNSFNSLHTSDTRLLAEYKHWLMAMISKSTAISGQAERIRHDFYKYNTSLIIKSANSRLSNPLF